MPRNNLWRLLLILFVVGWACFEIYPPTNRDIVEVFQQRATNPDAGFAAIIERARRLQMDRPGNAFGNLLEAVGTNDLTRYFPYRVQGQKNPNLAILYRIQREASGKIKLGLDLQGGVSFLVRMDTTRLEVDEKGKTNVVTRGVDKSIALENAVEVLRKRVDVLGVAEPLIQPVGEDRILVQLPGVGEAVMAQARENIQRAAFLEFRMLHPNSAELLRQGFTSFPGYEKLKLYSNKGKPDQTVEEVLVKIKPEQGLTGKYVTRAFVQRHPVTNKPIIILRFDNEGATLFGKASTEHVRERLGIVLDGDLISAPVFREPITGGSCEISGDFELKEAYELASALENPLEAPVKIEEEQSVTPSLGKDTIQAGIRSAIYGVIAVGVFMLVYYMLAGVIANVAMLINILVLLGVMCSIGTTLTLPGIAGIVLTIGMAVDANVLIYERIREELAAGKSLRGALNAGYDKAFGTIFDSNLTTLIASVLLIYLGTGPVKGFGVVLTIGITVSMFTALVITRLIFDFLLARGLITGLPMLHIIRGSNIKFMALARPMFIASWVIILAGIGYGVAFRGKALFGHEFRGGDALYLTYSKKVEDLEKIRSVVTAVKFKDADGKEHQVRDTLLQYQRRPGDQSEQLRVTVLSGAGPAVASAITAAFPDSKFTLSQLQSVGPTVGGEIMRTAAWAVALALFGILVYVAFRYEFSFSIGAVIAIIHDLLMTLGLYFLCGRELNGTVVAALLTIIGFSINDTIVIFDRIREDLKLGVRGSFSELMDIALNQTLSRTIITSGTVFLATLSLFIFGGGVINDFALTFLFGIITGTYSSIYIASAIVLWWHKGKRPDLGATPLTVTRADEAPPRVGSASA
jgi:SecD/SecF fusion protein